MDQLVLVFHKPDKKSREWDGDGLLRSTITNSLATQLNKALSA
jgi:hypothetical protein